MDIKESSVTVLVQQAHWVI